MGALFSAISGKFSSTLLIGTFLPVLLFVTLYELLIEPLIPGGLAVPETFQKLDTQWKVLLITFAVILLTGVLAALNHLIVSFATRLWAGSYHEEQRQKLLCVANRMGYISDLNDDAVTAANSKVVRVLSDAYPISAHALSTRLGNAIGNAESYFKAQYKIDHAVAWWRLAAVMDTPLASALDELKALFDFTLHTSLLAMLSSVGLVIYALSHTLDWTGSLGESFAWRIGGFALISRLAYLAAVDRMKALGKMERTAIDLSRLKLLKQLGFDNEFPSVAEESKVWSELQTALEFPGETDFPPNKKVATPSPATTATVGKQSFPVARAIRAFTPGRYPSMQVELTVSNGTAAAATAVLVSDSIPGNWFYCSGSATVSAGTFTVKATSPLQVELQSIPAASSVVLVYSIQCSKAGNS